MEKIIVEDRTIETVEQKLEREVLLAGKLIAGFTIQVSGARPPVGLGALAWVLGMGAARTGASLDDVLEAVKNHYQGAQAAMADEAEADELPTATGTAS
jgi:hypothetical protein